MKLYVGMRVKGTYDSHYYNHPTGGKYTGTVMEILELPSGRKQASIKRDDNKERGWEEGTTWGVHEKPDGTWGGDLQLGTLLPLHDTSFPWEP